MNSRTMNIFKFLPMISELYVIYHVDTSTTIILLSTDYKCLLVCLSIIFLRTCSLIIFIIDSMSFFFFKSVNLQSSGCNFLPTIFFHSSMSFMFLLISIYCRPKSQSLYDIKFVLSHPFLFFLL